MHQKFICLLWLSVQMKEDDSGHKNSKKRHKGDGGGEDDELGSMRKRRY